MKLNQFFTTKNLKSIKDVYREIEAQQKKYEAYEANPYTYEDNARCSLLEDPVYYWPVFKVKKDPVYPPEESYYRSRLMQLFPSKEDVFENWHKLSLQRQNIFIMEAKKLSYIYRNYFQAYPPFMLNVFW